MNPLERPIEAPFASPWEAQAFALAVALHDNGLFAWREFAAELGAEIKLAERNGVDRGYYDLWLAALEKLLTNKGLVSSVVVEAREAALGRTPIVAHEAQKVSRLIK